MLRARTKRNRVSALSLLVYTSVNNLSRKTTVMIHKMLGIECIWSLFADGAVLKPRQLFVTRSQHLADKVKESFARLYKTHVVGQTRQTAEDEVEEILDLGQWTTDLPSKFGELKPDNFPLFISFDHVS